MWLLVLRDVCIGGRSSKSAKRDVFSTHVYKATDVSNKAVRVADAASILGEYDSTNQVSVRV